MNRRTCKNPLHPGVPLYVALLTVILPCQARGQTAPAGARPAAQNQVRQATHQTPVVHERANYEVPANRTVDVPATNAGKAASLQPETAKTRIAEGGTASPRKASAPRGGVGTVLTALASLGVVLALFFALLWTMRRGMPSVARRLPRDVVDVLGYTTLGHRQQVQLLRLGQKLVLVSVTPAGAEPLAEVTDSAEVDRLAGLCRGGTTADKEPSFRDIFQQVRGRKQTGKLVQPGPLGSFAGRSRAEDAHA